MEVASLKSAQVATTDFLSDKKLMGKSSVDLKIKYGVEIPMSTNEQFLLFEEMLTNNSYFRKDVVSLHFIYSLIYSLYL